MDRYRLSIAEGNVMIHERYLCRDSTKFSNQKIRHVSTDEKDEIIRLTSFFDADTPLLIRLVAIRDGYSHDNLPLCRTCGKLQQKLNENRIKYYCDSKCYANSLEFTTRSEYDKEEANQRRRETMLSKYGVEFNSQRDSVKEILNRSKCNPQALKTLDDRDALHDLHIEQQLSPLAISQQLGVYYGTVQSYLKKHNIPYQFYTRRSTYELRIQSILDDLKVSYICNDRSLIHPYELDFYCEEQRYAIEVNGYYWHSSHSPADDSRRHQTKTLSCLEKGIRLFQVLDIDIDKKYEQVRRMIESQLVRQKGIGARACDVVRVDVSDARDYCDRWHWNGYSNSQIRLGLIHRDRLVSIMTFSKSRFGRSSHWEIVRYCSSQRVSGGCSRLINHFIKSYMTTGETLKTYVDLSLGHTGVGYEQAGMRLVGVTDPGYVWINPKGVKFSRYQMQKRNLVRLFSEEYRGEKEDDFLFSRGFMKYWNSGNRIYQIEK